MAYTVNLPIERILLKSNIALKELDKLDIRGKLIEFQFENVVRKCKNLQSIIRRKHLLNRDEIDRIKNVISTPYVVYYMQ